MDSNSGDSSDSVLTVPSKSSRHRLPHNSLQCFNWLTPRLAAVSYQPPSLLFTDRLSTYCSSKSESELPYDWRYTSNQFVLTTRPLRPTTSNSFLQLNTCGQSPYVTSSLTRGWICRLQLLLDFASSVILRFESRGTHDHILLSQIPDSPNLEGQVPVFISPRSRVARFYSQALCFLVSDNSTDWL
jgi:hypothetical protein